MDNSQLIQHSKKWDRAGLFVAGLCLIHCLALPLVISLLPALEFFSKGKMFEAVLLTIAILVGGVSFITTYVRHRKIYPMILGALGMGFLAYSLLSTPFNAPTHPEHKDIWEHLAHMNPQIIIGGLLLTIGHMWNIHACHCFCDKRCEHGHHH